MSDDAVMRDHRTVTDNMPNVNKTPSKSPISSP
jgi:hypothetical protein